MDNTALPVCTETMRYVMPTIDFLYPKVIGMKNPLPEQKMNRQIVDLMHQMIAEAQNPYSKTHVTGSYELKTNERNVLSLVLNAMGEFGGAHPMTYVKSLNMDTINGKNYKLYTQFKRDSNYIKRLSDIIAEQITLRNIPLLAEFKGIRPDQDFYIADINLVIYFQLYEIAPYAAGFPYFSIPIYYIQDIIEPGSLLDRMVYLI